MSQENVQIVSEIYDAFGKGDVEAVLAQMDQSIEWNEAENFLYADRNPYVGPQAVLEGVFVRLMADWEGFAVTPEEILDAGVAWWHSAPTPGLTRGWEGTCGRSSPTSGA